MSAAALEDFRPAVRTLIGDDDPQDLTQYTDDQIDAATKLVFQCGMQPEGHTLTGTAIAPAIDDGDSFALVVFKAAMMRLFGAEGGMSYRTRAISVTDRGDKKRDLLLELERMIHRIEGGSCCFATQTDFNTWFNDLSGGLYEKNLRYTSPDYQWPQITRP